MRKQEVKCEIKQPVIYMYDVWWMKFVLMQSRNDNYYGDKRSELTCRTAERVQSVWVMKIIDTKTCYGSSQSVWHISSYHESYILAICLQFQFLNMCVLTISRSTLFETKLNGCRNVFHHIILLCVLLLYFEMYLSMLTKNKIIHDLEIWHFQTLKTILNLFDQ